MTKWIVCVIIASATPAAADEAQLFSIVQEDFTIAYDRASGEPASAKLGKGVSGAGYTSIKVPDRGSVKVTISDGTGKPVATGVVADNGSYLLLPKGSGYALERVGARTLAWDAYPGVVLVNALPDSYKVDLFGHFGKLGLKDIKLATAFDAKQAIRIPSGDDRFKVVIHLPDGSTVETTPQVALGRYHVIHKSYDDKLTVSQLGYIETPDPKHKSK